MGFLYSHRVSVRDEILNLLNYDEAIWQVTPEAVDDVRYQAEGYVDSLHVMAFIIAIEDGFGIELPTEVTESDEFTSVGGVIAIVERLSADSNAEPH